MITLEEMQDDLRKQIDNVDPSIAESSSTANPSLNLLCRSLDNVNELATLLSTYKSVSSKLASFNERTLQLDNQFKTLLKSIHGDGKNSMEVASDKSISVDSSEFVDKQEQTTVELDNNDSEALIDLKDSVTNFNDKIDNEGFDSTELL